MIHLLLLGMLVLLLIAGPSLWVRYIKRRYAQPANRCPATGAECARRTLEQLGIAATVEETTAGDHYDTAAKIVRLASGNYHGRSLTAVAVSAHEVGHAIQDHHGYAPLRWRATLLGIGRHAERIGAMMLVPGLLAAALAGQMRVGLILAFTGFLALFTATLAHLVMLPAELDASFGRALPLLERGGLIRRADLPDARRVLTAAAMSAPGAALLSMLDFSRGRRRSPR